jgi:hypothetical protein
MLDDASFIREAHQVHLLNLECLTRAGEPERITGVNGAHARVRGHEVVLGDRLDQPAETAEVSR